MFGRVVCSRAWSRAKQSYRGMSNSVTRRIPSALNGASGALLAVAALAGTCAALYWQYKKSRAFGYVEECLPPPHYPWNHHKLWKSYDHGAIRRGFMVYNTIGIACHAIKYRFYRQLVDVAFTEEEAKAIAAEHDDYLTLPNDDGDIEERPGTLNDEFWQPFKNDKQARAANSGALPPDLALIVRARHAGDSYVMGLLTGYRDPPQGVKLPENMYYNLYFPGCQIAMPPPLAEGAVEYDDGTEASISQMAKDVTTFLCWTSFMEHDERHLMGLKSLLSIAAFGALVFMWKQFKWGYLKTRKVEFLPRSKEPGRH